MYLQIKDSTIPDGLYKIVSFGVIDENDKMRFPLFFSYDQCKLFLIEKDDRVVTEKPIDIIDKDDVSSFIVHCKDTYFDLRDIIAISKHNYIGITLHLKFDVKISISDNEAEDIITRWKMYKSGKGK